MTRSHAFWQQVHFWRGKTGSPRASHDFCSMYFTTNIGGKKKNVFSPQKTTWEENLK